jgi:hypothetical protein
MGVGSKLGVISFRLGFYQWTEVREKFKLKDGGKCIWFKIVKNNACKLSGRTLGAYTGFKSRKMVKHLQIHSSSKPNSSLLHNQKDLAYLESLPPKGCGDPQWYKSL